MAARNYKTDRFLHKTVIYHDNGSPNQNLCLDCDAKIYAVCVPLKGEFF